MEKLKSFMAIFSPEKQGEKHYKKVIVANSYGNAYNAADAILSTMPDYDMAIVFPQQLTREEIAEYKSEKL